MSYVLTVIKTPVDIPEIPGDDYPDDDPENPGAAEGYMFSSFSGFTYIVDLTINLYEDVSGGGGEPIYEPVVISSLSLTTPGRSGVTFTTTSSTSYQRVLRMSGTLDDAVFNSTYNLVLPSPPGSQEFPIANDVSTSGLPEYLAIIEWTQPTNFSYEYTAAYVMVVNAGQDSEITRTFSQFSYWGWPPGLASFQADLAAGSI